MMACQHTWAHYYSGPVLTHRICTYCGHKEPYSFEDRIAALKRDLAAAQTEGAQWQEAYENQRQIIEDELRPKLAAAQAREKAQREIAAKYEDRYFNLTAQTDEQSENIVALKRDLAAAQARIELLEGDMKTGNYETLYAQTVQDLAAAQADVRDHIELCLAANKLVDEARAEAAALRAAFQWLEANVFERKWNGVLGSGLKMNWTIAANYRHVVQRLEGETLDAAIDQARGAAHE